MATTTNFSFPTPDDTAYVKDGAAAIRSLGTAIDTTVATMVPKTVVDAKGDLLAGTAADTIARLAVGTNGQVLTANSATATGLEFATPASGGGMTLISTTTLSGASTTISSIPQTYNNLYLVIKNYQPSADQVALKMRFNSSSTSNTYYNITYSTGGDFSGNGRSYNATSLDIALGQSDTITGALFILDIPDYINTDTRKWVQIDSVVARSGSFAGYGGIGTWNDTSAVSSLLFFPASGTFTGTILLYGVK